MLASYLAAVGGSLLILIVLWDGFETIVLPRRVSRRLRLTRFFARSTWASYSWIARRWISAGHREGFLAYYGPLALLLLLISWVAELVLGFAALHWAFGSALPPSGEQSGFTTDLYFSGTTFFTLGLGDVRPITQAGRVVTAVEAGLGFGFLAMVISYLPVVYQSFSRREVSITLLDSRAGSPPTAAELLRRRSGAIGGEPGDLLLRDWERWCAELLESHLSYPFLAFFRSQHDNQSWLAALTMILDVCALSMVGVEGMPPSQARITFAMARHAAVDLAQLIGIFPRAPRRDRLPPSETARLMEALKSVGVGLPEDQHEMERRLRVVRALYEPYVAALADRLLMSLPLWIPHDGLDAWQTSAWDHGGDETGGRGPTVVRREGGRLPPR